LSAERPRLHLVDGTYELFRAWFSKRPDHVDAKGRNVKATVGVVSSMFTLLADAQERATHVAAAFDNPIRSFRNDLFDGYKTDEGVPEELLAQFDRVEDAMSAMGVTVWSMDRWEADDALATGAARWASEVEQVRILTPDKDLGQCLRGQHVVQVDRVRNRLIDEDALLSIRGVRPASIPDYLALVGDTADGIPGIPGFGEKTAATLLLRYDHLEGIPVSEKDWDVTVRGAERLAATLRGRLDDAKLYRKLATLVTDVPLPGDLESLRYRGVSASFDAWCDEVLAPSAIRNAARAQHASGS
jgi:5'-3' exonuclease